MFYFSTFGALSTKYLSTKKVSFANLNTWKFKYPISLKLKISILNQALVARSTASCEEDLKYRLCISQNLGGAILLKDHGRL